MKELTWTCSESLFKVLRVKALVYFGQKFKKYMKFKVYP